MVVNFSFKIKSVCWILYFQLSHFELQRIWMDDSLKFEQGLYSNAYILSFRHTITWNTAYMSVRRIKPRHYLIFINAYQQQQITNRETCQWKFEQIQKIRARWQLQDFMCVWTTLNWFCMQIVNNLHFLVYQLNN